MKVFVAYGYNERDKWIKDLVLPVVKAISGIEALTGENLTGQEHVSAIQGLIKQSHGFIGFLTKRDENSPGLTHDYVVSEIGAASMIVGQRLIEVRESGINQMNLANGRQFIAYDGANRAECISQIATTLAVWANELNRASMKLVLSPPDLAKEMKQDLKLGKVTCKYFVKRHGEEAFSEELIAKQIFMGTAGLECVIPRTPYGSEIQVIVQGTQSAWTSVLTPVDDLRLTLEKD